MNLVISGSPEEGSWIMYLRGSRYVLNEADIHYYIDKLSSGKQLLVHGARLIYIPLAEVQTMVSVLKQALRPMTAAEKYGELMYNTRGEMV